MRRIGLTVVAMAFLVSMGYAQQAASAKAPMAMKHESRVVVGKVESVTLGDAAKATKPEIVLVEEKGAVVKFGVAATAVIHDAGQKATTLDKIVKDEKIQVRYHDDANGVKEITSIAVVK